MTRAETLRALAERVEACPPGRLHEMDDRAAEVTSEVMRGVTRLCVLGDAPIWPGIDGFGAHPMESLDGCTALHKAVFGDRWRVRLDIGRRNRCWLIAEDNFKLDVYASTPARAWLAAILRALAEDEGGKSE